MRTVRELRQFLSDFDEDDEIPYVEIKDRFAPDVVIVKLSHDDAAVFGFLSVDDRKQQLQEWGFDPNKYYTSVIEHNQVKLTQEKERGFW